MPFGLRWNPDCPVYIAAIIDFRFRGGRIVWEGIIRYGTLSSANTTIIHVE